MGSAEVRLCLYIFSILLNLFYSEVYGRRNVFIVSYGFFILWNAVTVASPNMGALLSFRFLAGAFGSSPLTNAGGTVSRSQHHKKSAHGFATDIGYLFS